MYPTAFIFEWLTILDGLKQENIILKNRLSAALIRDVDDDFVEQAEFFQKQFIDKDIVVELLRHDCNNLLIKINATINENQINDGMQISINLLTIEITKVVEGFKKMTIDFDQYIECANKLFK